MRRATTKHDIPNDQRLSLYHELLQHKENGRLPYGKGKELMQQYGLSKQTLSKIWKAGQESKARTGLANIANKKKGRCGHPRRRSIKDLEVAIKAVPPHSRLTLRSLAVSSGIAPTTLWRLLQSKKLRRRTSHLKPMVTEPMVTDKHKADRVDLSTDEN
ncbi:hypothetical protein DYB25_011222 [Aphanomyces astaci]|uniref:DUF7769 domain-containing protein n=1 Tax=Aphanomyces astaci TaxID=112090 RepID=A0A397AYR3_APHAT|nr:hypothetical protein DYB25_011222 [Aphanomyces astaci]